MGYLPNFLYPLYKENNNVHVFVHCDICAPFGLKYCWVVKWALPCEPLTGCILIVVMVVWRNSAVSLFGELQERHTGPASRPDRLQIYEAGDIT